LIAYRATALRLSGDSRYAQLHDYARLVRTYRLQPPARFADIAQFNAALAQELSRLRRSEQRPLAQSLRGGTQTERNLPADNPLIADFFAMLDAPIRDYIAQLRDHDGHPTDRRNERITASPGRGQYNFSRRVSHQPRASAGMAELGVLPGVAGIGGGRCEPRWMAQVRRARHPDRRVPA
jgi:hypothetical protein